MKKTFLISLCLLLAITTSAGARPPHGPEGGSGGAARGPKVAPLFTRSLIQPETIMRHQARLELSESQRKSVQKVLRKTRSTIQDTRWELAAQTETIRKLLTATPIDQIETLQATEGLFRLETTIKTQHLQMLIEITNVLEPDQLKKARRIQKRSMKDRGGFSRRRVRPDPTRGPEAGLSD